MEREKGRLEGGSEGEEGENDGRGKRMEGEGNERGDREKDWRQGREGKGRKGEWMREDI